MDSVEPKIIYKFPIFFGVANIPVPIVVDTESELISVTCTNHFNYQPIVLPRNMKRSGSNKFHDTITVKDASYALSSKSTILLAPPKGNTSIAPHGVIKIRFIFADGIINTEFYMFKAKNNRRLFSFCTSFLESVIRKLMWGGVREVDQLPVPAEITKYISDATKYIDVIAKRRTQVNTFKFTHCPKFIDIDETKVYEYLFITNFPENTVVKGVNLVSEQPFTVELVSSSATPNKTYKGKKYGDLIARASEMDGVYFVRITPKSEMKDNNVCYIKNFCIRFVVELNGEEYIVVSNQITASVCDYEIHHKEIARLVQFIETGIINKNVGETDYFDFNTGDDSDDEPDEPGEHETPEDPGEHETPVEAPIRFELPSWFNKSLSEKISDAVILKRQRENECNLVVKKPNVDDLLDGITNLT